MSTNTLDQSIFDKLKIKNYDSEDGACEDLNKLAARKNSDGTPQWLFRGQQGRHERKWPPTDELTNTGDTISKHLFTLEGLVPTDYRGMEQEISAGRPKTDPDLLRKYGQHISNVRHLLTTYLIQCHSEFHSDAVQN